jgi:hypothetical protein
MNFERDAQALRNLVAFLRQNKKDFTVRHGTYTTILETTNGKFKYETTRFSDRVFIASRMVKKDVLNSDRGREIMARRHDKNNFGHSDNLKPFQADRVLNIDISSAYAACLLNNGLITEKTYAYLKSLKKDERLPAIGMLARAQCLWVYKNGECEDVRVDRSDTAQVFFYLIEEINYVMKGIEWELGKYYYFHWVDGIFFSYDTPPAVVSKAEEVLIECGYRYKYEMVTDFSLTIDKRNVYTVEMIKNDEFKRYQFSRDSKNKAREIMKYLSDVAVIKDTLKDNFVLPKED